jgi:hypothetical protein
MNTPLVISFEFFSNASSFKLHLKYKNSFRHGDLLEEVKRLDHQNLFAVPLDTSFQTCPLSFAVF